MVPVKLATPRLTLDCPTYGDVAAVASACADEGILLMLNRSGYDLGEAHAWVTQAQAGWWFATTYTWAIRLEGHLIGQVSLNRRNQHDGEATIGYWLHPAYRGRGYLREAAQAALAWALAERGGGLRRIIWHAYVWNEASARLASRLGFIPLGEHATGALGWNHRGPAHLGHLTVAG